MAAATVPQVTGSDPQIELVPNPDFVFPNLPRSVSHTASSSSSVAPRRPSSQQISSRRPQTADAPHRRGASALPNFSFNSADTSGLTAAQPDSAQTSPSKGSHRRNASEFVGGVGVSDAISSSPTKTTTLPLPPRRGHGHRRSHYTLSSEDWSGVLAGSSAEPRLSTSLPTTPLESPLPTPDMAGFADAQQSMISDDPFGPSLPETPARPPSRPRVEFSDNVEYIPRPLSTISSETGSSISTVRGHSVNNSISSVLSLSTPSPPSRARATSLETTFEHEPLKAPKSSLEASKRVEREGQWLKGGISEAGAKRTLSEPVADSSKIQFAADEPPSRSLSHRKRQSLGDALSFDRRRSEPTIGRASDEPSRLSSVSLQETSPSAKSTALESGLATDRRSSSRRLKDWAISKMSRRSRPSSVYLETPDRPSAADESPISEPAVAETDLDAVFSLDSDDAPTGTVRAKPHVDMSSFSAFHKTHSSTSNAEDFGTMLDLDAALGPFNTPTIGSNRARRELHSSRGIRNFAGSGGHYLPNPYHRRTESAPMLTPFDHSRPGTTPAAQATMADVFEEEEEEYHTLQSPKSNSQTTHEDGPEQGQEDEEVGVGVEIVDSDVSGNNTTPSLSVDDGLRIQRGGWELPRSILSHGNLSTRLSTPIVDRPASFVIEDTILEESSPVEPTIVEADEEPRASSLTKSSDSSETPTILAVSPGTLELPEGQPSLVTPETNPSSVFSSPDFARRQNSFDTSRVGTSASSMTDNRTMSSCTTGEPPHEIRISVDDIPSLTSSRSTMMSTMHQDTTRRDVSGARTPSISSGTLDAVSSEWRRKRSSIQSLSQLVGNSFGPRPSGFEDTRPRTAVDGARPPQRKEHRLKKLMFWKSKGRQASSSTIL